MSNGLRRGRRLRPRHPDLPRRHLRRHHLRDGSNPYNTYKHAGLPPGPIANPGAAALRAAVEPAKSDYLFFVSRNDGSHAFSRTYAEHEKMVDRYQRRRRTR